MPDDQDEVSCDDGVIVHFNAEAVLFEFSTPDGGEDVQIGMVKPSNVKVGTKCIPGNVKKIDTLSKYLEVGDVLKCTVVKKNGLKKVTFQKQEESGELSDVDIQPVWLATTAVKVDAVSEERKEVEIENPFFQDSSSDKDTSGDEEDVADQPTPTEQVKINQPMIEEEELKLPEPVKLTNLEISQETLEYNEESSPEINSQPKVQEKNSKSSNSNNLEEDLLELEVNEQEFEELGGSQLDNSAEKDEDGDVEIIIAEENSKKRKTSTPNEISPKKIRDSSESPFKVPAPITSSKPKKSTPTKLPQNKDPISSSEYLQSYSSGVENKKDNEETFMAKLVQFNKSSSVKLKGKVTSGILEVLGGEHKGKRGLFQVASCYVWGHHLVNANLMYNLRAGDKFIVQITLKVGAVEDMDVPLIVKKCWIGVKSSVPLVALQNVEFSAWLIERSLEEVEFLKWVGDLLPAKPFFPLKSEQFEAKVIMLIRESPKGDGALVRVTKEGDMKDNLAVFERDDFYICGVHVGEADMRFLIRPGDSLTIQLKELSEREKKVRIKKYPKLDEFEFNHSCLLAYIGDSRPRGPNMKPDDSPELRQFLDGKGMSIQEFKQMKESPEPDDVLPPSNKNSAQPINTGPGRLSF